MKTICFIGIMSIMILLNSCCTKKDCPCLLNESISISFYNNKNDTLKVEIIDKLNGQTIEKKVTDSYLYIGSYGNVVSKSIIDYTYIINYHNIKDTIKEITNSYRISSGVCNKCFIVFNGDKYNCKVYESYKLKINNKTIDGNEIKY